MVTCINCRHKNATHLSYCEKCNFPLDECTPAINGHPKGRPCFLLDSGDKLEFSSETFTLGRHADISFPDDQYLSKVHLKIETNSKGVWIQDLGSKNGTFLNDRRLNEKTLIKKNDSVVIGKTRLKLIFE